MFVVLLRVVVQEQEEEEKEERRRCETGKDRKERKGHNSFTRRIFFLFSLWRKLNCGVS